MSQTVTYTVLELNGDRVKLKAVHRQYAAPQEMPSTQGAAAKLESFDSTGSSIIETELTKVVPTSNQVSLDMVMDISVIMRIKSKTGIEFTMHRKDE